MVKSIIQNYTSQVLTDKILSKMDSLPNRIAQKRKLKGFTQEQLAEKLGKSSKQVISNWEKGRAEPSLADLRLLADVLGTTTSYLLEGDHR